MIKPEVFQALFTYNYKLWERMLDSIDEITDEQFLEPISYSRGSVRHQSVHALAANLFWLEGIQGTPRAEVKRYHGEDYGTKQAVRELFHESKTQFMAYVDSLTDEEINRTPKNMDGPIWQILLHLINHNTDHRAQVLRILADCGATTFDQDLIIHLWDLG